MKQIAVENVKPGMLTPWYRIISVLPIDGKVLVKVLFLGDLGIGTREFDRGAELPIIFG